MSDFVRRPPPRPGPGSRVLRNDHFQIAYATNDIDRACAVFQERYGIREFRRLEAPLPSGGQIRVELAWSGGVNYELLQASGLGTDFYNRLFSGEAFAIRHHHFGYFVHGEAEWAALEAEIRDDGWSVAMTTRTDGFLRACFIEAPELGHFLEYIFPEPQGVAFFESIPGN